MQWNTISKEEKEKRKQEWHVIFAWLPHKITRNRNGINRWAWLENIGRKYVKEVGWLDNMPADVWIKEYASKEDAVFYAMGGQEPEKDQDIRSIRPLGPPPMPTVKPPKKK
jgi:hypothetical protein